MKTTLLCFLALLCHIVSGDDGKVVEDSVFIFRDADFDDAIKRYEYLALEFYAPWW